MDWDRRQLFYHVSSSALLQIKNATNVFVGNFAARIDIASSVFQARRILTSHRRRRMGKRRATQVLSRSHRRRSWQNPVAVSPRLCDGVAHITQLAGRIAAPVI